MRKSQRTTSSKASRATKSAAKNTTSKSKVSQQQEDVDLASQANTSKSGVDKEVMTASLRRKRLEDYEKSRKKSNIEDPNVDNPNAEGENDEPSNEDTSNEDDSNNDDGSASASEDASSKEDDDASSKEDSENSEEEETELPLKLPAPTITTSTQPTTSILLNDSLLKSIKTHVASSIWNKEKERGPLKCISHWRN